MTIKANYPDLNPSLILDFVNAQALDPRVTFSRASKGTYVDRVGTWREAEVNQPRFDHDPATGKRLGLLFEEQRTNLITNPRGEGAANGVIGSGGSLPTNWQIITGANLSYEVVGIGTEDGLPYVDIKHSGIANTTNARLSFSSPAVTVTSGVDYSGSVFCKYVAGTAIPGELRLNMPDESGTVFTPTTASLGQQRITRSRVSAATSARLDVRYTLTSGQAYDFTVRYAAPQLELGAFTTTPIWPPVSTIAEATRIYDSATNNSLVSDWLSYTQGTIIVAGQTVATGTQPLFTLINGSEDIEGISLHTSGTDPKFVVSNAGVTQADLDAGTITANTRFKMAAAYATNDFAACVNGGAMVTDTSGSLPAELNVLTLGSDSEFFSPTYMNGYIQQVYVYPKRLTDALMQTLTRI